MDQQCRHEDEEEEGMDEDSENSNLLRLMARHTQLKDLLHAYDVIGTLLTSFTHSYLYLTVFCKSPDYFSVCHNPTS